MKIHLFSLLLLSAVSVSVQAKLYKWVDENGKVHYSDKKPISKENIETKELKLVGTRNKEQDLAKSAVDYQGLWYYQTSRGVASLYLGEGRFSRSRYNALTHYGETIQEGVLKVISKKKLELSVVKDMLKNSEKNLEGTTSYLTIKSLSTTQLIASQDDGTELTFYRQNNNPAFRSGLEHVLTATRWRLGDKHRVLFRDKTFEITGESHYTSYAFGSWYFIDLNTIEFQYLYDYRDAGALTGEKQQLTINRIDGKVIDFYNQSTNFRDQFIATNY